MEVKKPLMYADKTGKRIATYNPHPGCDFDCTYCYGKQTYGRSKCSDCKAFKPHFHEERMTQKFPKGATVFVESLGDPAFIPPDIFQQILDHLAEFPKTTFMIQSKDPRCFFAREYEIPENLILGTTIETNLDKVARCYSKAPVPFDRWHNLGQAMEVYPKLRYYYTLEPIMTFKSSDLAEMTYRDSRLEAVYIGRDNHGNKLPEPSEKELMKLVKLLQKQLGKVKVHCKTLGPAWWERDR